MAEKSIIRTTEEDWDELPKAQRLKLEWRAIDKWNWHADIDGESLPARIRAMDSKTFACYRDAKHLGCEATLELAKKRIDLNIISEFNRVARAWEKENPFELPSRFLFTQAERDKFRDHAPPAKARQPGVPRKEVVSAPRMSEPVSDPAPAAKPVPTKEKPVTTGAGKARPTVKQALRGVGMGSHEQDQAAKERRRRAGDKPYQAEVAALLKRGCTSEEVLRVTGWKAISMPAMAKSLGLELTIDKKSKPFKYTGK